MLPVVFNDDDGGHTWPGDTDFLSASGNFENAICFALKFMEGEKEFLDVWLRNVIFVFFLKSSHRNRVTVLFSPLSLSLAPSPLSYLSLLVAPSPPSPPP